MLSNINIDLVLSDPLLLSGALLFILSILVFLLALSKYIGLSRKEKQQFQIPSSETFEGSESLEGSPAETPEAPDAATEEETSDTPPPPTSPSEKALEKTMVMSANDKDMQEQFELAIDQIKSINTKIGELEDEIQNLKSKVSARMEPDELREAPMSPQDFTQKLLKLAEHVIILEKQMARFKPEGAEKSEPSKAEPPKASPAPEEESGSPAPSAEVENEIKEVTKPAASSSQSSKPPIMPL
jgi:hypothetical protein